MGNDYGNGESNFMAEHAMNENWSGFDGYTALQIGSLFNGKEDYIRLRDWDRQCGVMKIEPITKKQDFSYQSVAYINEGLPYPQIQRVPVSDIKVTPHQISFDFFDTTEGKIGVSNATEKHMIVECDIYVTEVLYYMWNHAGSQNQGNLFGIDGTGGAGMYTGLRFINEQYENIANMVSATENGCKSKFDEGQFNKNGEGLLNWAVSNINPWNRKVNDFQETRAFIDFRNTFMQQYTGWICKFTSETFGVFDGVMTDISYEIESGFSDAKWHIKIEEAIFVEGMYSEEGSKPQQQTSEGSQSDSGDVQTG